MCTKKSSGKLNPNKLPASVGVLLTAQAIGREMYMRDTLIRAAISKTFKDMAPTEPITKETM